MYPKTQILGSFLGLTIMYTKFFGFIAFTYPSKSLKFSLFGVLFFIANFCLAIYQVAGYLGVSFIQDPYINSVRIYASSIMQMGILTTYVTSTFARCLILLMNFFWSAYIFNALKGVVALDAQLNKIGIHVDYGKDILYPLILWIIKCFATLGVAATLGNVYVVLEFAYTGMANYITLELYIAITRLVRSGIIAFKQRLILIHENNSENQAISHEFLKVTSSILDLIKTINKAFGIQIFWSILVLLIFGVITVFTFISGIDVASFPKYRMILILSFVHFVILEMSHYGHSTHEEIKEVLAILRKLYSKVGTDQNSICLDVNLEIPKYSCGFITFDWEVFKMVVSTEILYFVILSQFQQVLNEQ